MVPRATVMAFAYVFVVEDMFVMWYTSAFPPPISVERLIACWYQVSSARLGANMFVTKLAFGECAFCSRMSSQPERVCSPRKSEVGRSKTENWIVEPGGSPATHIQMIFN